MKVAPDFEELVHAHYASLYRFALSLSRSEAEAADLTQQAFYLWATKGDQLRDPAQAKSWLFTTLYREFLRSRKAQERLPQTELDHSADLLPDETPSPDGIDSAAVLAALEEIDPLYRAPITLFYLQDFSYRQIAEVLGIPQGTVMSRLSRGKSELKRHLLARERLSSERIIAHPAAPAGLGHE